MPPRTPRLSEPRRHQGAPILHDRPSTRSSRASTAGPTVRSSGRTAKSSDKARAEEKEQRKKARPKSSGKKPPSKKNGALSKRTSLAAPPANATVEESRGGRGTQVVVPARGAEDAGPPVAAPAGGGGGEKGSGDVAPAPEGAGGDGHALSGVQRRSDNGGKSLAFSLAIDATKTPVLLEVAAGYRAVVGGEYPQHLIDIEGMSKQDVRKILDGASESGNIPLASEVKVAIMSFQGTPKGVPPFEVVAARPQSNNESRSCKGVR